MGSMQIEETKVFISSAMSKGADGIDWQALRNGLYEALLADEQFKPFGIENEASSRPSIQTFLEQVERTDFVVCMIGDDLRQGTQLELEHAFKNHKRVLLFFIGDNQQGEALELKKRLQREDLCCYKTATSIKNLPQEIVANLKSELTNLVRGFDSPAPRDGDNPILVGYQAIQKTTFELFGDASNVLFEELGMSAPEQNGGSDDPAPLEALGREAMSWLLENKPFSLAAYEDAIRGALPDLAAPEEKWGLRTACGAALHGDYHDAYRRLEGSLKEEGPSKEWQLGVALVDLRNYGLLRDDLNAYYAAQERIEALPTSVAFPSYEHCACQADDRMRDVEDWKRGLSVNTRGFNSKYTMVLDAVVKSFFIAVVNGSFSRMHSTRSYLAGMLARLARAYKEPSFAYHALRLSFVGADEKMAHGICRSDWPLIANIVPANADSLWAAACLCSGRNSEKTRCTCIELLAPYFSEESMASIANCMCGDSVRRNYPKPWALALRSAAMRLSSEFLVEALASVLELESADALLCFKTVLSNIDWSSVEAPQKTRLSSAFSEHWEWYLRFGGSAEQIGWLISENVLPRELGNQVSNALSGLSRASFESYLGEQEDCTALFHEAVAMAERQLEINSSRFHRSVFSTNPYASIDYALKEIGPNALSSETGKKLLSHFNRATKTEATDETLSPMLETMVLCASLCVDADIDLPSELIEAAGALRESPSIFSPFTFGGSTEASWQVRLAAVRTICGVGPADKLFSTYLSARDDYGAASVFGRLAPNLLRAMRPMGSSVLQPFALVLSTLAVDVHQEVRKLVSPAAVELLGTTEDEYGYRLFTQLVNDCDPDVRLSVLLACADSRVEVDYRALVQERLAQDANYHLRHHAERQRLECGI